LKDESGISPVFSLSSASLLLSRFVEGTVPLTRILVLLRDVLFTSDFGISSASQNRIEGPFVPSTAINPRFPFFALKRSFFFALFGMADSIAAIVPMRLSQIQ